MNQLQSSELFAVLVSLWPNNKATEATARLYGEALADLDFEVARRAVARLARIAKWFPTVAEIREQATDLEHGGPRMGLEAWGDVVAAIRHTGSYGVPTFDDPLVADCVRAMGSWRDICLSTNDTADRARFIELYNGLASRSRADAVAGAKLALPSPNKALRNVTSRDVTVLLAGVGK
jgi:hypothetical protein